MTPKARRSPLATRKRKKAALLHDLHHGDARELAAMLSNSSVDVTVTSPPYFNLKDYGVPGQIGFGQDYETYLNDLRKVFGHIFKATKANGSLWIVIDTFRRDQEVLPLPFDLVAKLKEVGWILRDVIIWKKLRTVPWTHKGVTRRIFEYILVLSKTKGTFRYFTDTQRAVSDLKHWWIRFPERYNPRGKALEEIWSYDIPKQGSWGQRYLRHFCPLPSDLVARIINLTTKKGDTVLDPFAGTGTVPVEATRLERKYIGFELNRKYISMFRKYIADFPEQAVDAAHANGALTATAFGRLIKNLRMLKFARLLFRYSAKSFGAGRVSHIFVRPLLKAPRLSHQICSAEYVILLRDARLLTRLEAHLTELRSKPPLSKFGVCARLRVVVAESSIPSIYRKRRLFLYSATATHQFAAHRPLNEALEADYPIVSVIRAKVEQPNG